MLWLLLLIPGFSEIMPDPVGADNNLEFVEFAWNESLENLTFVLGDSASNDTAERVFSSNFSQFILFVEEGFNYSHINAANCSIYSVGATIGNNLGNTNDTLTLFVMNNNETMNYSTNYSVTGCASGENCSLSFNDSWWPTIPTPCEQNVFPITENTTNTSENITECDFTLSIEAQTIFSLGETIEYAPVLEPEPDKYELTYWWTNVYGELVKEQQTTLNTNTKRYTPKQPVGERDWALQAHFLAQACNTTKEAQHLVVIKGEKQAEKTCPETTCSGSTSSSFISQQPVRDVLEATTPSSAVAGETISLAITLYNPDYVTQDFFVSAYVYVGSKNYTPREPQQFTLSALAEKEFLVELTPTEPGDFSLKIKAEKQGRKTPYELRRTITITPPVIARNETNEQPLLTEINTTKPTKNFTSQNITSLTPITGSVVQERSSNKFWISGVIALALLLVTWLTKRA